MDNNILELSSDFAECPISWQNFVRHLSNQYFDEEWLEDGSHIIEDELKKYKATKIKRLVKFSDTKFKTMFILKWQ